MTPYKHILVVCQGNICRSPVGEALLKQHLPGREVRSAGLGALVGKGVDTTAAEIATHYGLDVSSHAAQQIDNDLVQWADLILVMSQNQRSHIARLFPSATGKTLLLGHWLNQEIPDPYQKSREVFEHVHKLIAQSVDGWAAKI